VFSLTGEKMLTLSISATKAVASSSWRKGDKGLERMSHTLLSMLNDYNTPLQRKALFPN